MKFERISKEQAKEKIKELVNNFESQKDYYLDPSYNETMVRNDFIDKFFMALGWDVNDDSAKGNNREVIKEFNSKQEDSIKHPDYAFTFNREVKFFVEAKKPSIDLKNNSAYAIQIRKYGYTKKLKISILTDFEEFVVYDTTKKPRIKDSAKNCKIDYLKYTQYVDKFDELWDRFSWEAVYSTDGFETYIRNLKIRRTEEVDKDLLNTIEKWREKLAQNLALRNNEINKNKLNIAVQKIIDRLLFLRIAEDREMEEENSIRQVVGYNNRNIYKELLKKFDEADKKYNSGLFKNIGWFNKLNIDCKVIQEIIEDMYPPKCFYQWNVLPIEILGNIYEQFLGSEIVLKNINLERHTAKIVMKPETKKAGGVFYTPQYIVDYIVRETLGNKLKNLTIEQASKIKILDPACGSGSFLIGAFKYLMDWYYEKYTKTKKMMNDNIYKGILVETNHGLVLSIDEKRKILKNSIFGVDIDSQAVEVAKLSLYLQLFANHGYNKNLLDRLEQLQNVKLPDLSDNIKCGNSLIGTDIYTYDREINLSEEEKYRINPFDWDVEFKDIIDNGGFDVVIGNPPYYNIQSLGANNKQINYIKHKYNDVYKDKSDILFYFVDKAMSLSSDKIGYIVSNAFLYSDKANLLRNKIVIDNRICRIVNFEEFKVFGAGITTCIILFDKFKKVVKAKSLKGKKHELKDVVDFINNEYNFNKIKLNINTNFSLADSEVNNINNVIDANTIPLGNILFVGKGMETAANDVFCFEDYPKKFPAKYIKKRIEGVDICPYYLKPNNSYILYYEEVEDFNDLPKIIQIYLNESKKELKDRATVKNEGRAWWKYSRPMHKEFYDRKKIWCSYRSKVNRFYLDESSDCIGFTNTTAIFDTNPNYDLRYILGILNSKLIAYRYRTLAKQTGDGVFEYVPSSVRRIPIAIADIKKQQLIINLVDKIMTLTKNSNFDERAYKKLMSDIDKEVYKIYNISMKEQEYINEFIENI